MGEVRRARAAVTFVFFAHGTLFGTWVARIPAIKSELGLDESELGIALAAATVGGLAALPVAGWNVARRGSRVTVVWGMAAFALLTPVIALAPGLVTLALALFAAGVASSALDVAMNAHGLAVEGRRGRPILSSLHAGWSFGGLAGAGGGGLIAAAGVDPLPHFAAVALVVGLAALAATGALLPTAADRPEEPTRLRRPPRRLAALSVLAFCGLFAEGVAADWSGVYLSESLGASAGVAALGFASFSVAMAVFRLIGDRLTMRLGPSALARAGGILAGGALAVALVVGDQAVALLAFACMGVGLAAIVPIAFRAAGSLPGLPAGVGIAALTTVGYSAFLVGPTVIGFVADAIGLARALGIVVVLLGVLAVLAPAARPAAGAAAAAPVPAPR